MKAVYCVSYIRTQSRVHSNISNKGRDPTGVIDALKYNTMTALRNLLRCASLAVAALTCRAFAPSAKPLHCGLSLSAASPNGAELPQTANTRRSFLVGNAIGVASAAATLLTSPLAARAEEDDESSQSSSKIKPLSTYIYNVLRVREATEQETRLISTGKFKDVQRANVKLAVKFMINNFKLSDSVIAASSYLAGNARVQASGIGLSAVQNLYTIVEYFDSSDVENIKVRGACSVVLYMRLWTLNFCALSPRL